MESNRGYNVPSIGESSPATAEHVVPVIAHMEHQLEDLEKAITAMQELLGPVIAPEKDSGSSAPMTAQAPIAHGMVVERLLTLSYRVECANRRILHTLDRLEI